MNTDLKNSYYGQLKKLVLPKLTHFQTDLTELDRKALYRFSGSFVYGYRVSGTDLYKLDTGRCLIGFEAGLSFVCRTNNKYLFACNGVIKSITRKQAIRYMANDMIQTVKKKMAENYGHNWENEKTVVKEYKILIDKINVLSNKALNNE